MKVGIFASSFFSSVDFDSVETFPNTNGVAGVVVEDGVTFAAAPKAIPPKRLFVAVVVVVVAAVDGVGANVAVDTAAAAKGVDWTLLSLAVSSFFASSFSVEATGVDGTPNLNVFFATALSSLLLFS